MSRKILENETHDGGVDREEAHGAPALRRSLADIAAEYREKDAALTEKLQEFERATAAVKSAGSIGGAWGGNVFDREPYIYERTARKALLRSAWRHTYDGLRIADISSAKDRKNIEMLLENPPAFTLEALRTTFGDYLLDPRFHILKGLAECFCGLDPAYRSHSRVKIGVARLPKRIIVSYVSGSSSWGFERIKDTVNALRAYRGQPRCDNSFFYDVIRKAQMDGVAAFDGGHMKLFKNQNAHLIFDAHGLHDINMALAEFYGDILPDSPSETEARRPSTAVARDLQFYPTPRKVIDEVLSEIHMRDGMTVLEPSCGDGRILDALAEWKDGQVKATGIEWHAGRVAEARAKGHAVMQGNFLQVPPDPRFDLVIMNPPFHGRHYQMHLDHAQEFLAPNGVLACILPASAQYDHGGTIGTWHDLPIASFSQSGTNIPTGFTIFRKRLSPTPAPRFGG